MKTITSLFLLLASLSATAQYHKIGVQGRQWNEYEEFMTGGAAMRYYEIKGDSLYKGEVLPRLVRVDSSGSYLHTMALVREDSLKPSITFIAVNQSSFSLYGDSLVLDLSLSTGDSAAFQCSPTDTSHYILDSTGTFIDAQGVFRKQYYFHVMPHLGSGMAHFNWIEGIGSTTRGGVTYFLPRTCIFDGPPIPELLCVTDTGGINLYKNPVRDTCEMTIGLTTPKLQNFELYPNPVKDILNISSGVPLESVRIYDLRGNLLRQIPKPQERIDLKDIPAGLYILPVEGRNTGPVVRKFRKN